MTDADANKKSLYLIDRLSLPVHAVIAEATIGNMRRLLGSDAAMKPDFVQDQRLWDEGANKPTKVQTVAHYHRASVVRAFADLAGYALPQMERITDELCGGEGAGWRLLFAGRAMDTPDISRTVVYHFWRVPDYDSLPRLMYALREADWYIVLQMLIELEQQSLAMDSTIPYPAVPVDPDPHGTGYLLLSQRVHPINRQVFYEDAADYIDRLAQRHKLSLGLRTFATTGDLGTQQRLYVGTLESDIAGMVREGMLARQQRLFHPGTADLPYSVSALLPYIVLSQLSPLEPMPYCPHKKHLMAMAAEKAEQEARQAGADGGSEAGG